MHVSRTFPPPGYTFCCRGRDAGLFQFLFSVNYVNLIDLNFQGWGVGGSANTMDSRMNKPLLDVFLTLLPLTV